MTIAERELAIRRLRNTIEEAYDLADQLGYDNIFYNEAFLELFMAEELGHKWNQKTQGADAFDEVGHPVEYKMRKSPDTSFQFHWLSEKKMAKLTNSERVYFATADRTEFNEIWSIEMEALLPSLNESSKASGGSGHRNYSLEQLIDLGATRVR